MAKDPFELSDGRAGVFPLGLCIATASATGLGLAASALNLQWGAQVSYSDALPFAWVYTNLGLLAALLLIWPAAALRGAGPTRRPDALTWDVPAMVLAAAPALALAAWIAGVSLLMIANTLAVQAATGLLVLGLLMWRGQSAGVQATLATFLAALLLTPPVLAYLQIEYFGQRAAWLAFTPAAALLAATRGAPDVLWLAAGYAILGVLLISARLLSPPTPAASAPAA